MSPQDLVAGVVVGSIVETVIERAFEGSHELYLRDGRKKLDHYLIKAVSPALEPFQLAKPVEGKNSPLAEGYARTGFHLVAAGVVEAARHHIFRFEQNHKLGLLAVSITAHLIGNKVESEVQREAAAAIRAVLPAYDFPLVPDALVDATFAVTEVLMGKLFPAPGLSVPSKR